MPTKWTPELDQLVFVLVLKTHELKPIYKKIVEAWPDDAGDKPTERALVEHFSSLRKKTFTKFNVAGTAGSNPATPASGARHVSTPKKATATAANTPTSGKSRGKRSMSDEDDSEDEAAFLHGLKQDVKDLGIKAEEGDATLSASSSASDAKRLVRKKPSWTPSKRARVSKSEGRAGRDEGESGDDSDGSDFVVDLSMD